MKKRGRYRLPIIEDAKGGTASVLMAALSGAAALVSALIAFGFWGKAGIFLGAFGLMGFLMAVCGFFIGMRSFKEEKKNYRFSTAGSLANGLLAVFWLAVFLIGIS